MKLVHDQAGVFVAAGEADQLSKVVGYIKKNARVNDGLLTILYFPMFNFLTGIQNPTFYDIFFPHNVGSLSRQKAIIDEIKNNQIRFIVATEGLLNPCQKAPPKPLH